MIKITDRFYINANSNNYILQEKTKVQDENSENYGKEVFKDSGYYTTLESCLKGYLKTVTREFISSEEEKDVRELITQVQLQNEFIESLKLNI